MRARARASVRVSVRVCGEGSGAVAVGKTSVCLSDVYEYPPAVAAGTDSSPAWSSAEPERP